jgi:hypothetical protein
MFASCATIASMGAFAHVNIGVSRCVEVIEWKSGERKISVG